MHTLSVEYESLYVLRSGASKGTVFINARDKVQISFARTLRRISWLNSNSKSLNYLPPTFR